MVVWVLLCHSCGFACQQRVLKLFPSPGYLCSEDGVVWLWHWLVYIYTYSCSNIASLFQEQTSLLKYISVLPVVHIVSLTIMTYLKILIGIKSFNTKQCLARLSPPPVKLSSFIGGKFFLKKERVIYDCCFSLCL